ncbi:MAG: terpene cyclase/mutase family protein [Candidatus Poribacteria bacterium]|nr:terpene cyclase/mutase family protein [Candidatus Poribacteria bacterium]MDE0504625.1 terpene cyclase/mutase family protein [Candidatus Poribacteria bacterium]
MRKVQSRVSLWWICIVCLLLVPEKRLTGSTLFETIERAESYIIAAQNDDGGWPLLPGGESDVEITSFAMQALMFKGWGTGSTVIRRGVKYLTSQQLQDGSWNGNTAHTIFVLVALAQAETDDSDERFAGLKWIRDAQNENGSWAREMHKPGNSLYTAAVLAGLKRLGFKADFRPVSRGGNWISRGSDWLAEQINVDGGWSLKRAGRSDVLVTAWVLQGLAPVYNIDVQIVWLKQMQNEDGGFGRTKGEASDPEISAYAVMALAAGKDPLNADRVALGYLTTVQQEDGGFESDTPVELKEPMTNLQSTCFALIAMYARQFEKELDN